MRIQNKETSTASTSNVSDLLTAHDFSWLVQAMEQLGIARQVRTSLEVTSVVHVTQDGLLMAWLLCWAGGGGGSVSCAAQLEACMLGRTLLASFAAVSPYCS